MQLTFRSGHFVLKETHGEKKLPDLKAAAEFRSYSDTVAEKVFDRAFAKHYKLPSLPKLSFLDPHQRAGVKWALTRSRSYLAHAPGAGKTCSAITISCLAKGPGQTLFIIPPGLDGNWVSEINKFCEPLKVWPNIAVVPLSMHARTMKWDADFILCPDSMLTRPWVYEEIAKRKFKVVAVDEASRFKDPLAERSKAFYGGKSQARSFPSMFANAAHTIFLDGSPMPNRPMELWAPTYALFPQAIDCMSQSDFGFRYCGPRLDERGHWTFMGSSNEEELKARLQKDFMHVVTEAELTHPERLRSMVMMNEDARSPKHVSWEKRHLHEYKNFDESSSQGDLAFYRRELGERKVPWIAEYVAQKLKSKNESILLFVWHREVAMALAKKLEAFNPGVVIGGVKNADREQIFEQFQSGKRRLIIGNILAMGRGVNLQKANRVIFGEYSWGEESNKQAEKRASRRGNNQAFVRCEYIVSPGSIDEKVLSSVFSKQRRFERIIG